MKHRIEKDAMGEINVPVDSLYGAATQRALENTNISDRRFSRRFIEALGLVKWACASANARLNLIDHKLAKAIQKNALQVAEGTHDGHFVLDIYQTGSGTSTNMNANEIIANLCNVNFGEEFGAKKPVHPNDHVNLGQSSNDVIPSVIHIAAILAINADLLPALKQLHNALKHKSDEFNSIIKIGRTHLQDATPITLGQEFSGYAAQVHNGAKRIQSTLDGLLELAIGGTAVGTGLNTHAQFAGLVCENIAQKTGFAFRETRNHFEAQASQDACVFLSGALKTAALALLKIANDLRLLASGPRCGLYEIKLQDLQPGSSIMPGKVNPVLCESVMQIAAQIQGNDLVIQIAAQHGSLELNTMMPVLAGNLLESVNLLARGAGSFAQKCVQSIRANKERCYELAEKSLALATRLVPVLGYDKTAAFVNEAHDEGCTIRQLLNKKKILPQEHINQILDPAKMLKPDRST